MPRTPGEGYLPSDVATVSTPRHLPFFGAAMSDNDTSNAQAISASAIWALERLAEVRYGRGAPALGWSITRELISAGFVSYPTNSRASISITTAGRTFLKSRK